MFARAEPSELAEAISKAVEHVNASIKAMRRLITDMRPESLDQLGVQPALKALIERSQGLSELDITLQMSPGLDSGDPSDRLVVADVDLLRLVAR